MSEPREMRRTDHPNGLKVLSYRDDEVLMRWRDGESVLVETAVLQAIIREHGQTPRGMDWLTPDEQKRLEYGIQGHTFDPGYSGISCAVMVMRADYGEDCGLPASSSVHDDPRRPVAP